MIKININQLLERENKSLYWLAQETGLSYPAIHRLVNSKTNSIAFDTLEKICIALDCDICDVLQLK